MRRLYWVIGGVSLLIAALATYLASGAPDGLERVSKDLGFEHTAAVPHGALLPDYQVPGMSTHSGGALAGVLGVFAVLALSFGLGWLLKPKKVA
jgi:cobalt/nickel transport protein